MLSGTRAKTASMPNLQVLCNDKPIDRVSNFKFLGVKLDTNLTFHEHVQYIKQKTIGKINY